MIKAVLNVDYEPEQETEGSQHGAPHHRPTVSETFDEVRLGQRLVTSLLQTCSIESSQHASPSSEFR